MQVCFVLARWAILGVGSPYKAQTFRLLASVLFMSQLFVTVFSQNYKGILKRGRLDEIFKVVIYTIYTLGAAIVFLFMIHQAGSVSRLQTGVTLALFIPIDILARTFNKMRIFRHSTGGFKREGRSLVLMTAGCLVDDAMVIGTAVGRWTSLTTGIFTLAVAISAMTCLASFIILNIISLIINKKIFI